MYVCHCRAVSDSHVSAGDRAGRPGRERHRSPLWCGHRLWLMPRRAAPPLRRRSVAALGRVRRRLGIARSSSAARPDPTRSRVYGVTVGGPESWCANAG